MVWVLKEFFHLLVLDLGSEFLFQMVAAQTPHEVGDTIEMLQTITNFWNSLNWFDL